MEIISFEFDIFTLNDLPVKELSTEVVGKGVVVFFREEFDGGRNEVASIINVPNFWIVVRVDIILIPANRKFPSVVLQEAHLAR